MKKQTTTSILLLALASCTSTTADSSNSPIAACEREDVQDVVGKEVRSMMLKANLDGVILQAILGGDAIAAIEGARVSFHEVGTFTNTPNQTPFKQIVCGASMQIDASTARTGQDILTIPRLRWSINFTQPTEEPSVAGFTIAVEEVSISDGLLVNGEPAPRKAEKSADPIPSSQEQSEAERAGTEMEEAAAAAEAAADAAAQAAEDAKGEPATE